MDNPLTVVLLGALVGELALEYLIGVCPLLAVSRKLETAIGMAAALLVTAPVIAICAWLLKYGVLMPANIEYVELAAIVLLTIVVVRLLSQLIRIRWPSLWSIVGVFMPLLAVNCGLLGIVFIVFDRADSLSGALLHATGLALGYGVLLIVVSEIHERLSVADVPAPFRGMPVLLITLGIIAMALEAFGVSPVLAR